MISVKQAYNRIEAVLEDLYENSGIRPNDISYSYMRGLEDALDILEDALPDEDEEES